MPLWHDSEIRRRVPLMEWPKVPLLTHATEQTVGTQLNVMLLNKKEQKLGLNSLEEYPSPF